MIAPKISLLIIDDSADDAELAIAEVERSGWVVNSVRVADKDSLRRVLDEKSWDAVICDHKMPGFTSLEALTLVRERDADIPFLIVSGVIGEEAAVEAMRAGANDYILKHNLLRLVPALERGLREASIRRSRNEEQARLFSSERRFKTLASIAPLMIWETDAKGIVTYISPRSSSWLNESERALFREGKWEALVHPDDYQRVLDVLAVPVKRDSGYSVDLRVRSTGEWRYVRLYGGLYYGKDGGYEGFIGAVTDISELVRAKQEAEMANRSKSSFLATMSHEIRTPLGAILGFTDLLREEDSPEERNSYLDIINRNGTELLRIIGDILDLSKVEAGKMELEYSFFRIRELVDEVKALLEVKAWEKNLALKIDISPRAPEWIESDRTRLRQILINLVGNAIKFTDEGLVRIALDHQASPLSPKNGWIRFVVEDSGKGIPKDVQDKLFAPFSQADASTTRQFGGTGLGLVLSRYMARALGGDVVLDRAHSGPGARFVFTVLERQPTRTEADNQDADGTQASQGSEAPSAQLDGVHVLLVDDMPDNRLLMREWLERNGAEVRIAINGEDGVEQALKDNPNVVLMDLQMPVVDGYEALRRLRAHGFSAPIVAITAHAMKGERESTLGEGFDQFLTKPLDLQELVRTVRELTYH